MNLAENLARSAAERGDHVALKLDDAELTYEQLDCAAARVANLLARQGRRGRRPGRDHAARTSPTSPPVYYGVLRSAAWSCR